MICDDRDIIFSKIISDNRMPFMRFFHRGSESFHLTIEHDIIEDIDGLRIGPFFSDYGVDVFSVFQLIISMSDPDLIIQINIIHEQHSDSKI